MVEVTKQIISDIGEGHFETGVRWLSHEGIHVYQDNRYNWRYYMGQKASEEECRAEDVHPVLCGYKYIRTCSKREIGAQIVAEKMVADLGLPEDITPRLAEYLVGDDAYNLEAVVDDCIRSGFLAESNGSWYEPEV